MILRSLTKWMQTIGPGLITAALVFGPSKLTITSKLGAEYGFELIWIVPVAILFMVVFTTMSARIGLATDVSLLTSIRKKFGVFVSRTVGVGIFLVCISFQAGNAIGVGIAIGEMTSTSSTPWVLLFSACGISLLFFRSFYKVLERAMILLILLMLICFITTLIAVQPPWGSIVRGLRPALPQGSAGLVIAFMASCVSIVGAFYQSYLVQERKKVSQVVFKNGNDSITGIVLLGVMSGILLISAATILHPQGLTLTSATDMSKVLEPIFDPYASLLFLTGLFGAAFSSIIGNATVGGTLLGDALGYGSQLSAIPTKIFIAIVMVFGAIIAIIFGALPLQLIVFAQSITIFIVPVIGISMYLIANDAKLMGHLKNTTRAKILAGLGLALIIGLALVNAITLFF
ncbi:Nramp family divalent metal transporter [Dyadobacter tibetensis]|uniref:Nramp family divalent metal transporter n=1 Tax=Dyadobacter tibetensis TaxID=1211851 RepID=UPI00046FB89C|nr:Nramp family divalent metal transporter [Dyadobacter tibetensis]